MSKGKGRERRLAGDRYAANSGVTSGNGFRRWRFAASILAMSMLIASCSEASDSEGGGGSDDPASEAAAETPESDGTTSGSVGIVLPHEPPSLGSWTAYSDEGAPWIYNIQEPLVLRDEDNELMGLLATEWEQVDDTTWRFQLREGIEFHDGTPFDAEAAAIALNYTWSEENNFGVRQFMGPQMTASASDEHVLDVTTPEPDPILPSRLYFSPIFSPQSLENDTYESIPVGTGPYQFVEWEQGQYLDLEANDSWWGNEDDSGRTPATIQDVRFTFRPEASVRASSVQAGEADLALFLEPSQCEPECVTSTSVQTVFVRLDAETHPAMSDVRVREAIAKAINTEEIVASFMPEGERASQLVSPNVVGYNHDLEPYAHDPDEARRLLADAAEDGVPVDMPLTIMARQAFVPLGEQIVQAIAAQLTEVGFNAESRVLENSLLQDGLRARPAPEDRGWVLLYMHGNPLGDLSGTAGAYYVCDAAVGTICDERLDAMQEEALTLTGEARQEAYAEMAQLVYDEYYTIPIGAPADFYAVSEDLSWQARRDQLILVHTMALE